MELVGRRVRKLFAPEVNNSSSSSSSRSSSKGDGSGALEAFNGQVVSFNGTYWAVRYAMEKRKENKNWPLERIKSEPKKSVVLNFMEQQLCLCYSVLLLYMPNPLSFPFSLYSCMNHPQVRGRRRRRLVMGRA